MTPATVRTAPAAWRTRRARRPRSRAGRVVTTVMWIAAAVWILPLAVVVITSLKSQSDLISAGPLTIPHHVLFSNYLSAWRQASLGHYLVDTIIICAVKVPLGLVISCLTAYGLTRFTFRLRRTILVLIIAGSLIPLQVVLIPMFRFLLAINLLNTYTGLILPYLALGLPFQVIFLTAFFNQIPIELEQAARIDGASSWRFLTSIVIPASKPILASLFILDFVATWNEFPIALTVLQTSSNWTVPLGLLSFIGTFSSQYSLLSATMVIAALPILILYVFLQRYLVSGFTAGALKG